MRPIIDRVFDRLTLDENGCWIWTGGTTGNGYGVVHHGSRSDNSRRKLLAHRVTYEHFRGPIPERLTLDHLCRVTLCANPWHLEAVTHRENVLRGKAPTAVAYVTNTCKRGHSLDDAYVHLNGRRCRQCKKILREKSRRKSRVA